MQDVQDGPLRLVMASGKGSENISAIPFNVPKNGVLSRRCAYNAGGPRSEFVICSCPVSRNHWKTLAKIMCWRCCLLGDVYRYNVAAARPFPFARACMKIMSICSRTEQLTIFTAQITCPIVFTNVVRMIAKNIPYDKVTSMTPCCQALYSDSKRFIILCMLLINAHE